MNEKSDQQRIRELIDACRPGRDELEWPEFRLLAERIRAEGSCRETFERSQQLDRAIAGTFPDVDVPAGLADRLLETLAEEGEGQTADGSAAELAERSTVRPRWFPASQLAAVGSIAIAISILVYVQFVATDPVTPEQFAAHALRWSQTESAASEWRSLDEPQAQQRFPFQLPHRAQLAARRWRNIDGATAACYELLAADRGGPAFLVVWSQQKSERFPRRPTLVTQTGGWCVAVWSAQGHLYALVIQGGPRRFHQLLPSSPTA